MQVIIRNTPTGLDVGQHSEVVTKVGPRTVFVPLTSHEASFEKDGKPSSLQAADTIVVTNTETGSVRKHELFSTPVQETDKFGRSVTKLADAAWLYTDSKGVPFISTYDSDTISTFIAF